MKKEIDPRETSRAAAFELSMSSPMPIRHFRNKWGNYKKSSNNLCTLKRKNVSLHLNLND